MDVLKIPFVEKVGIQKDEQQFLVLEYENSVLNHLETIHAGAQFALAESASGEILQKVFPEYVGKVIPVLRDSKLKFKKPAVKAIKALAQIKEDIVKEFKRNIEQKGRALVNVSVKVQDSEDVVICIGEFTWYVQKLEEKAT